ncbi:MAG: thermonuclease family protein [Sphingomonadaceae bacterium]|nr:thermonuclease family protein [Sphingomonadaceae bacterium]
MAKRSRRDPAKRRTWHGAHLERDILARVRRPSRLRLVSWPGSGPSYPSSFFLSVILLSVLAFAAVWLGIGWYTADPRENDEPAPTDFPACVGSVRINCVVDGDTFWIGGAKVRILDIDTPELSPPRCAEEERLGLAAKERLGELLSAGPVELASAPGEDDRDHYGRLLRTVHIGGRSVGDTLIAEGLARPYGSGRRAWC